MDKAEEFYLKSLEANPNHWDALYSYGQFLRNRGEEEIAAEFFDRATRVNTWRSTIHCTKCGKPGILFSI